MTMIRFFLRYFIILVALFNFGYIPHVDSYPVDKSDTSLFRTMKWRCIGPFRGGRVNAVAGVPGQPLVYYFGASGGGVWKTEDAGLTWKPITDGYFNSGSIGAIGISESNPNIIYVGMGESCLRNDISDGDGIHKSEDSGKTWIHLGLKDSRHIGRIRIHPYNSDLLYVAVLGNVYGPSKERGVFRSKNGGKTWEKILFVDDKTGAVDLAMDSKNPCILYAATWQVKITPWGIYSGGPGTQLYKSSDGGDTWQELTEGLSKSTKGRIGVAVSPVNPNRVWAIIAADDGGLFRSDDGGQTWSLVNNDWNLRKRHYYYSHVFADTQNQDIVYVFTSKFLKSNDGGMTFVTVQVPHADNHDLWIAPENNMRMINGNDGGANVSFNGGKSWTRQDNQPTAQMYRAVTDNQFPYRIYGAQQDNTTISIPSRSIQREIVPDMYSVAGGESGYIAVHPMDSNISYGGSYWGRLMRNDHRTKETRDISVWPEIPLGRTPIEMKYRFNWTFPIILSPHDPNILYTAANVLFKSTNEGQSWEQISPDLTRNDKNKQKDAILTQIYCTIFALAESPLQRDCLWVGSDDGLVHISMDGGRNWTKVTPKSMPKWSRVSRIEASYHDPATAYLAINRFDLDDNRPYIYKTRNFGKTWKLITEGILEDNFVHVVREDPKRSGLLYAGTEKGVYVSFDDGENWQSLQLNLPVVAIYDLVLKEDDLIVATHGRSFWILNDLTLMRQLTEEVISSKVYFFRQKNTYRNKSYEPVTVHYYLKDNTKGEVSIEFLNANGKLIKIFKNNMGLKEAIPASAGINRFDWDMRYPDARGIKGGTFLLRSNLRGPICVPGDYKVKLSIGGQSFSQSFRIEKDPRISATLNDLQDQFDLLIKIRDKLSATHDAVNKICDLLEDLSAKRDRIKSPESAEVISKEIEKLKRKLTTVLDCLVSTRTKELEEYRFYMHNHPFLSSIRLKLNNRLASIQNVVVSADSKPTTQCYKNFNEISAELNVQFEKLKRIFEKDVPAVYRLIQAQGRSPIQIYK